MSINNMTQAQKAQLRYVAIIEQSKNAMGDMARTIDSPANQLRILESRIQTLKRAIGDSLMPVLSAALPYVTAFVQILGEFFRDLANYLGFEVPEFDYSSLEKGNIEVAQSFDEATAASEKFKGSLSSIDQLNIIGSKKESGGGAGDDLLGGDLNLDLPSYDFLGDLTEETTEAYKRLKDILSEILPIIGGVATALGALWVADKVSSGVKALSDAFTFLTKSPMGKVAATIGAAVTSFLAFKNAVKDAVLKDNFTKLGIAIGGAAAAIGIFIATGNPVAAVVTGIAAAVGSLVGYFEALDEIAQQRVMDVVTESFERGETPITDVANAIDDVTDNIIDSNSKFLEQSESLQTISASAEDTSASINGMLLSVHREGKALPGVVDKIIAAFQQLSDSAEQYLTQANDNLKLFIYANAELLEKEGYNVDKVAGVFDSAVEKGKARIDELKQQIDEYSKNIEAGINVEESTSGLREAQRALMELSGVDVDFSAAEEAKKALEGITEINFSGVDNLDSVFQGISDKIAAGYKSFDDTLAASKAQLDYDLKNGLITQEDYDLTLEAFQASIDAQRSEYTDIISEAVTKLRSKVSGVLEEGMEAERHADAFAEILYQIAVSRNDPYVMETWKEYVSTYESKYEDKLRETMGDNFDALKNFDANFQKSLGTAGVSPSIYNDILMSGFEKTVPEDKLNEFMDGLHTLTRDHGEQLPQDIADGIDSSQETVTNSLNGLFGKVSTAMSDDFAKLQKEAKEGGTELQKTLQKSFEGNDNGGMVSKAFGSISGGLLMGAVAPTVTNSGADAGELTRAGTAWNAEGTPVNVNVNAQTYVEMDGEQVGSTFYNYSERQMAYSNGR